MVDMTNFNNWTAETEDLSLAIESMIIDYLKSSPNIQAEAVIPGTLLAAFKLHLRVCDKLGIAQDKATADFLKQAGLAPLVHTEQQAAAAHDHCLKCGCTETQACATDTEGGACYWIGPGLCSACEETPPPSPTSAVTDKDAPSFYENNDPSRAATTNDGAQS